MLSAVGGLFIIGISPGVVVEMQFPREASTISFVEECVFFSETFEEMHDAFTYSDLRLDFSFAC